ncbi:MAG: methylmalonyl-CoA mutase family protein [Chloroflexota bacterium]|nr:methylmalonyl-CoA mutase family protein [Chloroflexota bacterium]
MTHEDNSGIRQARREWESKYLQKRAVPPAETDSGIELDLVYTPDSIQDSNYIEDIGFPGDYPFLRGVQPTMYRERLWTMRQYSGFGTAEETNQRYRYLLDQGQTGLSVAFDLPTQIGYDSDHPLACGEVGRTGVAVDSLADMETIFQGLPLDKLSTSMTINAPAPILLAMYIAMAEKQGVSSEKLNGTIQNDVLKEYTVRGTYIFPVEPSLRLVTNTFEYCSKHVPRWNTINIASYHMREAGCDAVQEIAFTFANAITYVEAGIRAGLDVDSFAPRISWIFNTYNDFFEEIAKFRAARRLWARIMKERFQAKDPKSWMFRTHTQTGGSTLTAEQPLINIARATYQTMAAVLGGVQSLAVSSYDEGLCIPTEESAQVSLRTQQLIAYESGVTKVIDPLAGSYYVESLTNEIEQRANEYIKRIDDLGGAPAAIQKGYVQKEILQGAYRQQQEIESGKRTVIGVNKFKSDQATPIGRFEIDPTVEKDQTAKLSKLKNKRDNESVSATLASLREAAHSNANLMPLFLDAAKAYATLGEICGVLRDVFGEYEEATSI